MLANLLVCIALLQEQVSFSALNLDVALPPLADLKTLDVSDDGGRWTGKLGESSVMITLVAFLDDPERFVEPEDVSDLGEFNVRPLAKDAPAFRYERTETPTGKFGLAPFASLGIGDQRAAGGEVRARVYQLGALLEQGGYLIDVRCQPPPNAEGEAQLLAFLKTGVVYRGKVGDGSWTEAEIEARWKRDAPDDVVADHEKPIVTEHYLILGNSSGGKLFAKKMEEAYATIQKTYPFAEVKGRKKMPVFLFRTPEQYYAYYVKVANTSLENAKRSKGHAWKDYYATWYEAPNDPVHIHEATHQIFANRLHLSGGGSWFQEGVAEYIETKPGDRSAAATSVKKGRYTKLAQFMQIESLLGSADENAPGGDQAADHYKQAAVVIEFARESKFGKERFDRFLVAVGRVRSDELADIEAAIRSVYGVDLAGFEAEFVKYCQKR
ncbi:MAG: hypothetical protein K8S98_16480 [Planctomycetes bacterium]|nr:hypothetical protein [Planctomycetota bacterium]